MLKGIYILLATLMIGAAGAWAAESGPTASTAATTDVSAASDTSVLPVHAEEQQPVFKTEAAPAKEKTKSASSIWSRILLSLAIAGLFGCGTYLFFRKYPLGKKQLARARMIQVLSQHHMGPRKSLAVVRVAGETVLIGVTENNITLLKSLALLDEDVPQRTTENFEATLDKKTTADEEEFSMRGLRDLVGAKLKNMREL
jgi:flagellar protein FliO/FliZ